MTTEAIKQHTGNSILELCAMTDRTLAACGINPNLIRTCQFETQESVWGACDGQVCLQPATVFDLFGDRELCQFHFQKGAR